MVVYAVGTEFPINIFSGDVLFIGGRLPLKRNEKPVFEHVAIAYESKEIGSVHDLADLRVVALPEAGSKGVSGGLFPTTGNKRWRDSVNQHNIGCTLGIWNFIAREDSFDKFKAEHCRRLLSLKTGSVVLKYLPEFRVDPTFASPVRTNCLGFVCSFFELFGIHHLQHDYPTYENQHLNPPQNTRDFPSPGHLALVLESFSVPRPYCPPTPAEAAATARVDVTADRYCSRIASL